MLAKVPDLAGVAGFQRRRLILASRTDRPWATTGVVVSRPEQQHLRDRQRLGVRDCHQRCLDLHPLGMSGGAAVKLQAWRTTTTNHFDVLPHHTPRMTRAERLHGGFLRGEPARQMRRGIPPAGTIRNLRLREHALKEPIAVPIEERREAWDVGGVKADAKDSHERTSA